MTRYAAIRWQQIRGESPSCEIHTQMQNFVARWLDSYYSHRTRGYMPDQLKQAIDEQIPNN